MKKFKRLFKTIIILCIIEIIVLTFTILNGINNGFKLWNWIIIIGCIPGYLLFILGVILWENKDKKKVSKEDLIVTDFYKEQAKLILGKLKDYLNTNPKVYMDLRLYWPLYEALWKRIANGKKFNSKEYDVIEELKMWQKVNYEDDFLVNIYNVLKNNLIQ